MRINGRRAHRSCKYISSTDRWCRPAGTAALLHGVSNVAWLNTLMCESQRHKTTITVPGLVEEDPNLASGFCSSENRIYQKCKRVFGETVSGAGDSIWAYVDSRIKLSKAGVLSSQWSHSGVVSTSGLTLLAILGQRTWLTCVLALNSSVFVYLFVQ